jgi:hypothetical protein
MSGDTNGHIFSHLRACHHLIGSLLGRSSTLDLYLEWYAYLVSCNTFTPYGTAQRLLPHDNFQASLMSPSGAFFAGCQELHYMIPEVSFLAARRLAEEGVSADVQEEHDRLYEQLTTWTLPEDEDMQLRHHAAEALRHAIHIFLATALAGAIVDQNILKHHVHAVFAATPYLIEARRYVATILWPLLIAGSCIVKPEWQQVMLSGMRGSWAQIRQLEAWSDVLELLYEDPDPRAFGPYGLYLTMEKHGMNLANA